MSQTWRVEEWKEAEEAEGEGLMGGGGGVEVADVSSWNGAWATEQRWPPLYSHIGAAGLFSLEKPHE